MLEGFCSLCSIPYESIQGPQFTVQGHFHDLYVPWFRRKANGPVNGFHEGYVHGLYALWTRNDLCADKALRYSGRCLVIPGPPSQLCTLVVFFNCLSVD